MHIIRWIRKAVDWVAVIIVGLICYFFVGFISCGLATFFASLSDATSLPKKLHNTWEDGKYNKEILVLYVASFLWVWHHWRQKSLPKIIESIRADVKKHREKPDVIPALVLLFFLIFFGYKILFIVLDHIL